MIEVLQWYRRAFACDKKTEIFPKQDKVSSKNTFYSWINLPYFNANDENNHRKMLRKDGELVYGLSEALALMQERRLTLKEHQEWIDNFEYKDAPPCILSGLLLRDIGPGQRNNWLFSVGVYFRLKDENCDLRELLSQVNESLKQPISEAELENTILKGFNKKTYFYMCGALDRCDKADCRQKEFGIESKVSTGLDFGEMIQYMTDPPYYEWFVNGQKLTFWSETEIIGQAKFRALCLRQLHVVPRHVPDDRWAKILSRACENIKVVEISQESGDFSTGSTFFDLTCQFFNTKRRADNISQIYMGRIFVDKDTKEYVFLAKYFIEYVVTKNDFHSYQPIEMKVRLEQMGAHKEGKEWRIPMSSIPEATVAKPEIDFRDREEYEDF